MTLVLHPPATAAAYAAATATASRLALLRARPRRAGEASFFFYDSHFKSDAVKVLPGEYFVHTDNILITTTLGSCIAACLWDRVARVGGMNHFMLPEGRNGSGRYGAYAMEVLINEMMKLGATRPTLEAKLFGGAQVMDGMDTLNIGERNTEFAIRYLEAEHIQMVSNDVRGPYPRKLCFLPASGKAMVKRLTAAHPDALAPRPRSALPADAEAGTVDLF